MDGDLPSCVERVRLQDPAAAEELVERLYPLVARVVRSHLPRRVQEEDLAQEIFLKLFSRLDQYEARSTIPFEHWVARLAVRTCLDSLRAERRRPEIRWADLSETETAWLEYLSDSQGAEPETSASAAREVIELLLGELAPADRLVIHLLDLEERSVRDISQLTGWSATLVKVRAFRARRKLRKIAAAFKQEHKYERI
jgi:RNA polymerase sigma factor (sigma-70 family)